MQGCHDKEVDLRQKMSTMGDLCTQTRSRSRIDFSSIQKSSKIMMGMAVCSASRRFVQYIKTESAKEEGAKTEGKICRVP